MKKVRFILIIVLVCLMFVGAVFVFKNPSGFKSFLYRTSIVGLKNTRELMAGFFVFGNYDQANWHLTLAKKRLTEAEKLRNLGDIRNFQKFVVKSKKEKFLAGEYLQKATDLSEDVNYLKLEMEKISQKQNEIKL